MLRIVILLAAFAAGALVLLPPERPATSNPADLSSSNADFSQVISYSVDTSTERRRQIFCSLVENSKRAIQTSLSPQEMVSFDLATPEQKWEFLKDELISRGCPDMPSLTPSLGIRGVSEIEFGTMDGADLCRILTPQQQSTQAR